MLKVKLEITGEDITPLGEIPFEFEIVDKVTGESIMILESSVNLKEVAQKAKEQGLIPKD